MTMTSYRGSAKSPRWAAGMLAVIVLGGAGIPHGPAQAQLGIGARANPHGPAPSVEGAPRIDSLAGTLFAHRARSGKTAPFLRPNRAFEQTGELPLVVRFRQAPTLAKLEALSAAGVRFEREARPTLSGAYLVRATRDGAASLERNPDVVRLTVDLPRPSLHPWLEDGGEIIGAGSARRAVLAKDGERLDGAGTVIADLDSPVHVLHPSFFRSDGGTYPWVDVDQDGVLTPGVDGVDLDGSGTIEPSEVLRPLLSKVITLATGAAVELAAHSTFSPDTDYLYLDTNGNGVRDSGAEAGFDERTPAYGEPLFVFDDADRDGSLIASERLVRLGSSKFKRIRSAGGVFERGAPGLHGLVAYDPTRNPVRTDTNHATAVTGILVGGQLGLSRWAGIAPGAEVILDDGTSDNGGRVAAIQWAIDQRANVILTEFANYSGTSVDGSNEEELLLDAANAAGILTVSPAGNLAISKKHRTVLLKPGPTKLALVGDALVAKTYGIALSMHYRGVARTVAASIKLPTGEIVGIPEAADDTLPSGKRLWSRSQTTPRGTHERFADLTGQVGMFVPGAYELTLDLDPGPDLEVDLFAGDGVVAWSGGFTFQEGTASRTLCSPATSDTTISVGAYVLNAGLGSPGARGDLAVYSSRGPRLGDGAPGITLLAPDNPITALPPRSDGAVYSTPFGGTSGAGPHVAASIALVRQAFPKAAAAEIKKKLLDSAEPRGETDERSTGRGDLDVAKAIGGQVPRGTAPVVHLTAERPAQLGGDAALRVDAEDDEPRAALSARWDVDYDGAFDTGWVPLGTQPVPLGQRKAGERVDVKVEVRDGQGNIGATTMSMVVGDVPFAAPDPGSIPGDPSSSGCACRAGAPVPPAGAAWQLSALLVFALFAARRRRESR